MKRLPGIVASAIVLLLGSLFQMLLAVGTGAAGIVERSQILGVSNPAVGVAVTQQAVTSAAVLPTWMPVFMYVIAGFFALLAMWGIFTAIGLFRMYRWARYSILVIGGCLAVIGLSSMLISIVLLFVPLPMPATIDPSQVNTVHNFTKAIFGVIGAFYGVVGCVGVFWLVYFNLKKVRDAFAGAVNTFVPGPRPFLISVVAVLNVVGAVTLFVLIFLPFSTAVLAWILAGWQKVAFALTYSIVLAATAYGLWNMKEWGRRLAIAVQVFGLAQYTAFLLRPAVFVTLNDRIRQSMKLPQQLQQPTAFNQEMIYLSMGLGMVFLIAILVILHYYRGKFRAPSLPPQAAAPALP